MEDLPSGSDFDDAFDGLPSEDNEGPDAADDVDMLHMLPDEPAPARVAAPRRPQPLEEAAHIVSLMPGRALKKHRRCVRRFAGRVCGRLSQAHADLRATKKAWDQHQLRAGELLDVVDASTPDPDDTPSVPVFCSQGWVPEGATLSTCGCNAVTV